MSKEYSSLEDLDDWILDSAVSESRDVERPKVVDRIQRELHERQTPELCFMLGYAYFHLWKPLPSDIAALCLESLTTALRLSPEHEFARLYRIYVLFECRCFAGCIADCRTLNREELRNSEVAWRLVSVDEIEFACLVELDIQTDQLVRVYKRIMQAATSGLNDLLPFRPSVFLSSVEVAIASGRLTDVDGEQVERAVQDLVQRAGW